MKNSVLITHPGRQHSHQLALALYDENLLAEYWTGVPARPLTKYRALQKMTKYIEKHSHLNLPDDKVRHLLIEPMVRRLTSFLPKAHTIAWSHRAMAWFDMWCASNIQNLDIDIVVAYENAAYHTFKKAKELGITTILDAASFHHKWQDRFYEYQESNKEHGKINKNKDREIKLADYILTVSNLARDSYIDAGIDPKKAKTIPVGCNLDKFKCESVITNSSCFTFIFAGHAGKRKGVDILNRACGKLDHKNLDYEVRIAGNWDHELQFEPSESIKKLGWIPHAELTEQFAGADCMVLPSRHDSFGMVVVEAMATGTPAIVSDHTGAKEAVTEGESGWVISIDDENELAERMAWCIKNPEKVKAMRSRTRTDAEAYSWERYHERVQDFYSTIINNQKPVTN